MKNRTLGVGALLLVVLLCFVSFVAGQRSTDFGRPVAHAVHEMNELDRLEMETAKRR
jgi:hypothetical protein